MQFVCVCICIIYICARTHRQIFMYRNLLFGFLNEPNLLVLNYVSLAHVPIIIMLLLNSLYPEVKQREKKTVIQIHLNFHSVNITNVTRIEKIKESN